MEENKFQLINLSDYKSGKKVIRARKGKGKLPIVNALMMQAVTPDWSQFEYWVSDERFLCTKHGKIVYITNLVVLIAELAEDDPELQMLALESLEMLLDVHSLDEELDED